MRQFNIDFIQPEHIYRIYKENNDLVVLSVNKRETRFTNLTDEEKEKLTKGLQLWLAMKYVLANRSICEDCARQPTCYRKQEKIKQCKLFEGKESEDNETI